MNFVRSLGVSIVGVAFVLGVAITDSTAADPVFSGPQVGEMLPGFKLNGVYDELAGKTIAPLDDAGDSPIVIVFVHDLTRPGFALTRAITRYTESLKTAKVYVAWLSDDQSEAEAFLNRARPSLNLNVPVGISPDGGDGPGSYGLNRNVELTILVGKAQKVTANFALVQPSLVDAEEIAAEVAKVVGKSAPSKAQLESMAFPGRIKMKRKERTDRRSTDQTPAKASDR
ncbi:hypothetical protein [Roseiconus lacunae]|uniref:hypothetical protein n=1 Tax=Roseiconus lacunae TaxID=2605694 RepID=UPI0011F30027|nr:hypothetical protein [Roseiconus lacunae]WRQ50937.1 hypothetical protein U8335_00010 [Stieleria sp. HD01]